MSGVDPHFEGDRLDYDSGTLDAADMAPHPLAQLRRWVDDAVAADLLEPTAMTIGTVGIDGGPRARSVLMRALDPNGVVFYTNTRSDKARELADEPQCSAHFMWHALHRQVRLVGRAEPVDSEVADTYFATRPRESQIGAWASPQSMVIGSRHDLDEMVAEATRRFAGDEPVPRPPHWGGFRVVPSQIEFWQGRPSRLHDRLRYRRAEHDTTAHGEWIIERLAP